MPCFAGTHSSSSLQFDSTSSEQQAASSMEYTAENWQAQLEEVLALQSIYAENFRVLHIPGQCTPDSKASSSSSSDNASPDSLEHSEQLLVSLIGSDPPPASAVTRMLCCEALVSVELPAGQLQLMIDTDSLINHQQQQQLSVVNAVEQHQHQQREQQEQRQQQQQQQPQVVAMPFGPPVCMQFQLPVGYPTSAQHPPLVSLAASWLDSQQQQALQQQQQQQLSVSIAGEQHQQQQQEQQQQQQQQLLQPQGVVMPFGPPIKHLPPVCMQFQLPVDYPTSGQHPPLVSVSASWLDSQQQQALQQQLQQLWEEQGPEPVCFSWLEHVKVSALDALGITEQLVLSRNVQQQQQQQEEVAAVGSSGSGVGQKATAQHPPEAAHTGSSDEGCSSSSVVPADQLAMQLLRYDAAREHEDFNNSSWTCNICFEQVPGSSCLRLPECHHFYCRTCLSAAAAAQLDGGAVENMRCPEPSCRRLLPPYVVKELLGDSDFARWEEMVLSRALDRMDDVVYCPRCDTVSVADSDGCAQCPKCYYAFCAQCSDSWHPGSACLNLEERVRILGRRRRGTTAEDRLRDLDLQNQAMNLKFIATASKSCPVCGMATMKNEGCNKMTCTNCGKHWCWKCSKAINGYEHYRDNQFCVLFEQAEIDRWHAMLFANERAQQAEELHAGVMRARHAHGARLCRCPVCGQENLREGRNNLLRCWSCTSHFCYACRAWLRGKVGLHFVGAKACKQHGD